MQILIYPLRSKKNKKGEAPLMIRVTVGPGDKAEINTGKGVDPNLWDGDKKRMTGKSVAADILNKYLVHCENKLNKIENDLLMNETPHTAEIIKNIFHGNHVQRYTLLEILDLHNKEFNEKKGQEGFGEERYGKYVGFKKKLEYFLQDKYNRKDIFVTELNYDFIQSFWHFLTTKGKELRPGKFTSPLDPETAEGKIKMLRKIGTMAFRKQGIAINPFDDFKIPPFNKEKKKPLSMDNVKSIMTKEIRIERLQRVRDRVVVGCFTGLSNTDLQNCSRDAIVSDMQGKKWLSINREKTNEACMVPLWAPVLAIIEKYKDDPELIEKNRLFPQISLQKMNAYLDELSVICDIATPLKTHICRHTFGNIYLNSGGTLASLQKILGHKSARTTKGYADLDFTSIASDAGAVWDNLDKYMQASGF